MDCEYTTFLAVSVGCNVTLLTELIAGLVRSIARIPMICSKMYIYKYVAYTAGGGGGGRGIGISPTTAED